jgi:SAM-dependent methyltransferase
MTQDNQVAYSSLSSTTRVYNDDKNFYHVLQGKSAEIFKDLMDLGVIKNLEERKLLVACQLLQSNKDGSIILSQPIGSRIYPKEWPLSLVSESGIKAIEIQKILDSNGYGLIDCHPYNFVLFDNAPLWVDLGSFEKKKYSFELEFNEPEFLRNYIYPYKLAKKGMPKLTRIIMAPEVGGAEVASEVKALLSSLPRFLFLNIYMAKLLNKFEFFFRSPHNEAKTRLISRRLKILPKAASRSIIMILSFLTKIRLNLWHKKLCNGLDKYKFNQFWSDYSDQDIKIELKDERFKLISRVVTDLQPKSILDVGGNNGELFEYLSQYQNITFTQYIVVDRDDGAIESGRLLSKTRERYRGMRAQCVPSYFYMDFANPWRSNYVRKVEERLKSDVVIALALTHHLLLTDGLEISVMWRRFAEMTERFLIVEFMPLGLWGGHGEYPHVPSWYNLEWFKSEMSKNFELVGQHNISVNRILLVAQVKS